MNDALRTNAFVRFEPETIACACIYLAARVLQVRALELLFHFITCLHPWIYLSIFILSISFSLHVFVFPQFPLPSKPHWYLLFGATKESIKEICISTMKLYSREKVT